MIIINKYLLNLNFYYYVYILKTVFRDTYLKKKKLRRNIKYRSILNQKFYIQLMKFNDKCFNLQKQNFSALF